MATTIQQTQLSVSLSENITINGVLYGNTINTSFQGNGKVDQRVLAINSSTLTDIWNYKELPPDGAGYGVKDEFTYFRITNTDDALSITLQLYVSSSKSGFFNIPPRCSFMLMANDMDFLCEGESYSVADLAAVKVQTIAPKDAKAVSSSYVEYIAVFKGGTDINASRESEEG